MKTQLSLPAQLDKIIKLFLRGLASTDETWKEIYKVFRSHDLRAESEEKDAVKVGSIVCDAPCHLRLRHEMAEAGFYLVEKCAELSKLPIDVTALRSIVAMLDVPSIGRTWLDDCTPHHSKTVRSFAEWYREQFSSRPDSNIDRIRHTSDLQPGARIRITGLRSYATFEESSANDHKPLADVGTFVGFASWHPYLLESAFVLLDREIVSARECHCDDETDDRPMALFPVKSLMMYGRQCINGFCAVGEKWSSAAEMSLTVEAHPAFPASYEEMHRRRGRYMRWGWAHPLPIDRMYCSAPDSPIYLAVNASYEIIDDPSPSLVAEIVCASRELHQALDALSNAPSSEDALVAIQRLHEREPSLILIAYPNLLVRLLEQSNLQEGEAIRNVLMKIGPPSLPRLICTLKAACHYMFRWDPRLVEVIAGALGQFGAQAAEAVPILRDLLSKMPTVREEIAAALALIDKNDQ